MARGQPTGLTDSRKNAIRLVVAPVILAVVLGILWIQQATGNPLGTDLLLAAFAAATGIEMARMLRASGREVWVLYAGVTCGLVGMVGVLAPDDAGLRAELRLGTLVACVLWISIARLRDTTAGAIGAIACSVLPMLSVGLLLSFARELAFGPDGAKRVIWVVVVAKASDMGGWLVGKPFGKHKILPSVSPGKSWEGAAGGLAASVAAAVWLPALLGLGESAWSVGARAGFGLTLGSVSILAGFIHSAWKRRAGVKDSSALIPEMGGILDMADSLLLAAPVAWLWYRLGVL